MTDIAASKRPVGPCRPKLRWSDNSGSMLEKLQCVFYGHVWQGWEWDPALRCEHHACTRCRTRETRHCQHEGQQLVFVEESERQSADYDGAIACYQDFLDRTHRCGRCDGEVTDTVPRDFIGAPVLEGRNVDVKSVRANPCGAAGSMVAEVVQWSGGSLGWSADESAVNVWIHLAEDGAVLDLSHGQQNDVLPTVRYALGSDGQNAGRQATRHLCEYLVKRSAEFPSSKRRYRRLGKRENRPVIANANEEEQFDRVRGRRVTVCAFPDYALWLIGVTQAIKARLEGRGATVQVDLLESTVSRQPTLTSDVDIILISTRAGETDYGQYRARKAAMAYRLIPRGAWEAGNGLGEIYGVMDECDISYWPNPPLPLLPNTVEEYTGRPVIEAVDQVLRQIPFK